MINAKDIKERIESEFGDKASEVFAIFDDALSKTSYLNQDRIIRCILFLSDGDIEELKSTIKTATCDPRDIILWAEYEKGEPGGSPQRIRNFDKTFDQAEKNLD